MIRKARTRSLIGLSIILTAAVLFVPSAFASPNDACFAGCHDPAGAVNRIVYDSNPHSIIECIDCHENSTIPPASDPNHGKFIRQLNGSKISGPLLADYSSESFSLCYYCHNETKLVGMAPGFIASANHRNFDINVSEIGTNFINIDPAGYHNGSRDSNGSDVPTNIHWNHLDAFGSSDYGVGGRFDSNMDGTIDSYQSCTACHNPHGTSYPKMTRNDIQITSGNDSNGTFMNIGSENYKFSGGDAYCTGTCHTSGLTFRYYRNETNTFEDCISCHVNGVPGDVNITAFSEGEHVNINTTGGAGVLNNNDCWTCHYLKNMNKSDARSCNDCHVSGIPLPEPAPVITSHISGDKITNYSCTDCHNKAMAEPGSGIPNITSHYLKRPVVTGVNYCEYCHGPDANTLFRATNKIITEFNHDDSNWDGNATCRTCHSNSSVSADPKANDTSSFHDLTSELGDAYNGTTRADCVICHIKKDIQFVLAPNPPVSHPDTSNMTLENCFECHGTDRHNVAGSCIQCHAIRGTRYYVNTSLFLRHVNVNRNDGIGNMTDDDCKTCHFGSASMPMDLGAANHNNTYFCNDCHTSGGRNPSQYNNMTDETLKKMPMPPGHGENGCEQCHIPGFDKPRPLPEKVRYHSHGPKGFVE